MPHIILFVVIGVIILIAIGFPISIYNRLVMLRNRFQNAYSQIDVQLKRRYDLIPNLVETAKGYMAHERQTLEAVIAARNNAAAANLTAAASPGDPNAIRAVSGAESALTGALGKLFAVAEAYPNLKANEQMNQLTEELTSTENRVAFARQAYNDSVMVYNTARQTFPNILLADMLGFREASLFNIENPQEREAVKVKF
ncbi:MAG TPA: LemA family protein [Tepidisphaeraceae bacterium]|jgi:LemA protein|nr:LemA family protein [Tepidisphaeraceae bacterium]